MGLFKQKKKSSADDPAEQVQHFFDENFREELRNHGRWYFEKVINENGALFKQDLDTTLASLNTELKDHITTKLDDAIAQVGTELKGHVTQQIEQRFAEHAQAVTEAQDKAIAIMTESAGKIQQQHEQLAATLEKSLTDQEATLATTFEGSKAEITKMKETQALTLQWLAESVKALQQQHEQLTTTLEKSLADQEALMMSAFEQNMAAIIEHYLLGALGDQYDLKAQLPSIIKQMEANKQAIVDDMKL